MIKLLNEKIKALFMDLFNRGGYVLNFSNYSFNTFTFSSVEIAIQGTYGLSKGKSLRAFLDDDNISDGKKIKLLSDMLEYYESNYENEYNKEYENYHNSYGIKYDAKYAVLYKKCKDSINKLSNCEIILEEKSNVIKEKFSSEYISKQLDLMLKVQSTNPTLAIGMAKELIESCCKTILDDLSISYTKNDDIPELTKKVNDNIKLLPINISTSDSVYEAYKQVLGNLKQIPYKLAEIRNKYGSGHGKTGTFIELDEACAKLAIGCSLSYVEYVWTRYEETKLLKKNDK